MVKNPLMLPSVMSRDLTFFESGFILKILLLTRVQRVITKHRENVCDVFITFLLINKLILLFLVILEFFYTKK